QINLSWADNSGNETGFKVERWSSASPTWAQIAAVGPNVTSYSDAGLAAGTTYFYRVRATNGAGDSAYSAQASEATRARTAPTSPSGLCGAVASATQVNLSWADNATNEAGYRVERSTDGVNWAEVAVVGANATSYSDAGLAGNTTYTYRVRATNGAGNSAYSAA